jgi:DNA polymerase-3 subunit beta
MLTIGEFARRCGVSRSALRFYDECGLLRPVVVDETTGYRYYQPAQVDQANLIRGLRATDMAVERVRAFLGADRQQRRILLESHLEIVEERVAALRRAVEKLRVDLDAEAAAMVPACVVAGATLAQAIGQVAFAAATSPVRPPLQGVLIEVKDGSLRLVATDSYRLAIRDVVPEALRAQPWRALVDAAALTQITGELTGVDRCALGGAPDGGLVMDLDGQTIALPPLVGEFPDYEQVLVGDPVGFHCVVDRQALAAALSGTTDSPATITFGGGRLRVAIDGRVEAIPTQWDGEDLTLTINSSFAMQAAAAHVGPDVAIEVVDALRPVTFRSADTGTLSVLVMPIGPEA